MTSKSMRFYLTISAVILTSTILWFVIKDIPYPRPLIVFIGAGLSLTILLAGFLLTPTRLRKTDTILLTVYIFVASFFIRVSGYLRVLYSGSDNYRLFRLVQETITAGSYDASGGLYASAPFYIMEVVVSRLITDVGLTSVRFIVIFISSTFPLLLAILAYRVTRNKKTAWFAGLVGVVSPLNLRTSALLEAESFILLLLVVFLIGMYATFSTVDRRTYAVTVSIAILTVLFHFLYSLILLAVYAGVVFFRYLLSKLNIIKYKNNKQMKLEMLSLVIVGICIGSYILWSGYSGTSVGIIASIFSVNVFDSIISVLLPSGNTASAQARSGGSINSITLLGRYGPLLILGLLGATGALESLRRRQHITLLTIGGALGILAVGVGIGLAGSGLSYQLRIYYFVTVILLLFAGIGIQYAGSSPSRLRFIIRAVMILLILGYMITAPLTPLANNVDPRFGGTSFATTSSELETFKSINQRISPSRSITVDQEPIENSQLYLIVKSSSGPPARITGKNCLQNSTIWTNGNIRICGNQSSTQA